MFTLPEKQNKRGFTLVELVVVIGVMSVLAAITIPATVHYMEDSRIQRDESAMAEIMSMTKAVMDSNIEAYDELYAIGQCVADGDAGVYIVWQKDDTNGTFVPYVLGEPLEDMAPTFYAALMQTMDGPIVMESSHKENYYVVTLQKGEDDELRWVTGGWSETETTNNTTSSYVPVTPEVPNVPNTPSIPVDIPEIEPGHPLEGEENQDVSEQEEEKVDYDTARGTEPVGLNHKWDGEEHPLITPGVSNEGTYYYKLSNSTSSLWQSGVPKATNVGEYQIAYYIEGDDGHQNSEVKMITATIIPGDANFTHPVPRDTIYTGEWECLVETLGTATPASDVHMVYSLDRTTWDPNPPSRQAVGKYTVYYKLVGSERVSVDDWVYSMTANILPWEGNFSMPTPANPTYAAGKQQRLVNAGTAPDGCTIMYRTENGTWSTQIPTAENAGTYNVYYKIDGGDRYTSVGETLITCEIKKANPILGLGSQRSVFNPPNLTGTVTIHNNSDGALRISTSDAAIAEVELAKDGKSFSIVGKNKGSAKIVLSVSATDNYNAATVEHIVEITIGTITATAIDGRTTYTGQPTSGDARVAVTTPSSGYTIQYKAEGAVSWQNNMPTFTDAGVYTINYAVSAEGFTQKTGTFNIIIEKAKAPDELKPVVNGYEWIYSPDITYSPTPTNLKGSTKSPDWQLQSANVVYSTFPEWSANDTVTMGNMPSVTTPGEVRLSNFVFSDRSGNYENITINNFNLNSKIDGTLTATNTLLLKCYDAVGDETVYYRTENGVLYLRKTSRDGYKIASLKNTPEGNMFLGSDTAGITRVHLETTLLPTNMRHWFAGLSDLTQITYNVIDNQAVQLDTRFTTSMEGMFMNCTSLTSDANGNIKGIDFSKYDTTLVNSFADMFRGCTKLEKINVSSLNGVGVKLMSGMFQGCSNLKSINLSNFATADATSLDRMFSNCPSLSTLDLSTMAVSSNATMSGMFDGSVRLETITFGGTFKWNTADGYVPEISNQYVTAANGKWYDISNANAYTPAQLATLVSSDQDTKTYSSVPYYWLDMINGMRDGMKSDTLEGLATVDVYINGQLVADDAIDWYQPYKYGTSYEFKNMTVTSNLGYTGLLNTVAGDSLSGSVTHQTVSWMKFETIAAEFGYTGAVQTFTAPVGGYYRIEAWGAQGGASHVDNKVLDTGLAGGYAKGNVYLQAGQVIYISVGGKGGTPAYGKDAIGGWNGGGNSTWDHNSEGANGEVAGAGGGATSIQLTLVGDGQLSNYENSKEQVVIVAGGGAGSYGENSNGGGVGGGVEGGKGSANSITLANQTSGYKFGIGQSASWPSGWGGNTAANGLPGAGGGWYGGYTLQNKTPVAGGGSGYIGTLANASMASGIRKGNGLVKISYSGTDEFSNPTSQSFAFTGSVQEFTVPISGYYKLEAWGAAGGIGRENVNEYGKGGYTSGITYLTKGTVLYVYVGEDGINQYQNVTGFNGGGASYTFVGEKNNHVGGRGGGATDFRLKGGAWNNSDGLKSRILVAGGGGGAQSSCGRRATAGHGGGLTAVTSYNLNYKATTQTSARNIAYSEGGSQTGGGRGYNTNDSGSGWTGKNGGFGYGAAAPTCASGGGGGYYGGGSGYTSGGGGGSSYVTGYPGCDTTYRNLQGGYNFSHVSIIAGIREGNGEAKITYMGDQISTNTVTLSILPDARSSADLSQFSLYVDGNLIGDRISSYIGEIPAGTTWSMENFTQHPIYKTDVHYICAERNGLNGVANTSGTVTLHWKYSKTSGLQDYGTLSDGNAVLDGQQILWTMTSGSLAITPVNGSTGVIKNFMPNENAPWYSKRTSITSVSATGSLTASQYLCNLFNGCTGLSTINLTAVNVSNTQYVNGLFSGCTKLGTMSGFSGTAYVNSFDNMFLDCKVLKTIDISALNAVNNATMTNAFANVPASSLTKIKTPTYWFFASNSGFAPADTTKWKHAKAGTVTKAEFMNLVTDPVYSGEWTRA